MVKTTNQLYTVYNYMYIYIHKCNAFCFVAVNSSISCAGDLPGMAHKLDGAHGTVGSRPFGVCFSCGEAAKKRGVPTENWPNYF